MKCSKHILFLLVMLAWSQRAFSQGQCLGGGCAGPGASFGGVLSTTSNTFVAAVAGTWAGEYNTYNVTNGMQYEWSLCAADGAVSGSANAQLTLKTTANVAICFSDDFCGTQPKIQWTATFTGQVRVLINQFNCLTASISHTVMWRCVTCTAPVGTSCGNPSVIAAIPFTQNGLTTCGAGNEYTSINACASVYMNGEDYVFQYTPAANTCVNIALSGTLSWTGIFVTSGCPNVGSCVAQNTNSAGNPSLTNVNLIGGVTYYFIVDTWPTPNCTPFNISVTACSASPPGSNCGNAVVIPSVPFTQNAVTTCGFGNDYTSANACASIYMNGDDFVYSFTPATNMCINVALTGTLSWTGVFVTSGCPNTGTCVAQNTNSLGNPAVNNVSLIGGVTYYIIVDTWPAPNCTPFNINITLCTSNPVTAGDCASAVNVCTNFNFSVDPSGFGSVDELCIGCVSNPATNPASLNDGCLHSGELNSTWMVVNVATSGTLEFSFGAPGGGVCFDWIMWPYTPGVTCNQIFSNSVAPIRCNWNFPCDGFTGMGTLPAGGAVGNFEPLMNVVAGQQYIICFSNYSSATTNVPLNFYGTAGISCTVLPIELVEFYGRTSTSGNQLFWKTASEQHNDYFTIEHSVNGKEFTVLEQVDGAGTSAQLLAYTLHDNDPINGVNYYRLSQTDFDGTTKVLQTISLYNGSGSTSVGTVYPNPTEGTLTVPVVNNAVTALSFEILDITGKIIYALEVQTIEGDQLITVPLHTLASGTYTLRISEKGVGNISVQPLYKY